ILVMLVIYFLVACAVSHRDLHSFPTRRSSDLSGSVQRNHCPEIGNPPKPRISSIPDFCSSGSAYPPPPTKTNGARTTLIASSFVERTIPPQSVPMRRRSPTSEPVETVVPERAAKSSI